MRPRSTWMLVAERMFRVCREVDEAALGSHEITKRELCVLGAVGKGTNAVPGLAALLGISFPGAMQIVESLEQRGLLVRTKTRGRRAYLVEMTKQGGVMLEKHTSLDRAVEQILKDRYGEGILAVLGEMRAALDGTTAKPAVSDVDVAPSLKRLPPRVRAEIILEDD